MVCGVWRVACVVCVWVCVGVGVGVGGREWGGGRGCDFLSFWVLFKSKVLTFEIFNVNYSVFLGGLRGFLCDFKSNNLLLIGLIVILHGFFSKTSNFTTFKNTFQSVVGGLSN